MKIQVYDLRHENPHTEIHRIYAVRNSLYQTGKRLNSDHWQHTTDVWTRHYTPGYTDSAECLAERLASCQRVAAGYKKHFKHQQVVIIINSYAVTVIATI